jgi:hypothetical protein
MTVLIKLCYAAAITALLVLFVAFGIRTFYAPPAEPVFPQPPFPIRPVGPVGPDGVLPQPMPEQVEWEEQQREYTQRYEAYSEELKEYRRNVFLVAAVLGVLALAAGIALPSHLDALRLGLAGGGLGTLLYAVIQAGGDLDEAGPALIFGVAAAGLVLVGYAGYRWLATRPEESARAG